MLKKYKVKYPDATRDDVRKKINSMRTNFPLRWFGYVERMEDDRLAKKV